MDLKGCIICGKSDNIVASISVTLDDEKYECNLCEDHCDDTTPKMARDALSEKKRKIDEFIKQAEDLGLTFVPSSGLMVPKQEPQQPQQPQQPIAPPPTPKDKVQEDIDTSKHIPSSKMKVDRSAYGHVEGENLPQFSSLDIDSETKRIMSKLKSKGELTNEQLPEDYIVESQQQVIRGGVGNLPKVIRGNTGTTSIKFNDSVDDRVIQERFRDLANESKENDGRVNWDYGGQPIKCKVCRGTGVAMNKICPKCEGTGFISLD